jgi:long-chain fatty acid transport protein
VSTPPHLYASYATGNFAYVVSAGVPFGGGVSWPEDWAGRHEIISSRLEVFRVAPAVAYRAGKLRVAAGVHADFGRMRVKRSLDFVDTEGDVFLDMDGRSVGFDLAAFYRATNEIDVGISYKSRATLELDGGADFNAPDAFNMKTADQHVGTVIHLPDRIALGAVWHRGKVTVLGDLEVTTWGVYDELAFDFENEATPDPTLVTAWNTTVGLRAGGEYEFRPGTRVRGGAFFDPSPASDENLAPSSPDSTRIGATVGVAHQVRRDLAIDGFYELMHLMGRESSSEDNLAARYGGQAHIVGVGVRLHR